MDLYDPAVGRIEGPAIAVPLKGTRIGLRFILRGSAPVRYHAKTVYDANRATVAEREARAALTGAP